MCVSTSCSSACKSKHTKLAPKSQLFLMLFTHNCAQCSNRERKWNEKGFHEPSLTILAVGSRTSCCNFVLKNKRQEPVFFLWKIFQYIIFYLKSTFNIFSVSITSRGRWFSLWRLVINFQLTKSRFFSFIFLHWRKSVPMKTLEVCISYFLLLRFFFQPFFVARRLKKINYFNLM
jgi:hypothetical protein